MYTAYAQQASPTVLFPFIFSDAFTSGLHLLINQCFSFPIKPCSENSGCTGQWRQRGNDHQSQGAWVLRLTPSDRCCVWCFPSTFPSLNLCAPVNHRGGCSLRPLLVLQIQMNWLHSRALGQVYLLLSCLQNGHHNCCY